ncbi:MAG: BlaI/MecI/CopY family transcriptional regulator [Lachnospiraceae bacterium]|nr:BlaI/MecI/CopY family transcriptional regulator [Lachnospiraceae bacterium]
MKERDMTPSELEVMRAVWEITEEGEIATTKTVRKRVNEGREEKLYGQIIYVHIGHLAEKGYVRIERTKEDKRVYIPLVKKEDYVAKQAKNWAKFWKQSTASYAMMALGKNIKKEEKEELRRYLDEMD